MVHGIEPRQNHLLASLLVRTISLTSSLTCSAPITEPEPFHNPRDAFKTTQ
jgi:hypothetical protein